MGITHFLFPDTVMWTIPDGFQISVLPMTKDTVRIAFSEIHLCSTLAYLHKQHLFHTYNMINLLFDWHPRSPNKIPAAHPFSAPFFLCKIKSPLKDKKASHLNLSAASVPFTDYSSIKLIKLYKVV